MFLRGYLRWRELESELEWEWVGVNIGLHPGKRSG